MSTLKALPQYDFKLISSETFCEKFTISSIHHDMLARLYKLVLVESSDKVLNYFLPDAVKIWQNVVQLYIVCQGYSHFRKLSDLMIKVNSFDGFDKSMHSFIKPTTHITIHILHITIHLLHTTIHILHTTANFFNGVNDLFTLYVIT